MSARDALMSFSSKQTKKARTNKRKNKRPEQEVVKEIIKWGKQNGFSLDVIEASGGRNAYGAITVKSGYSDISGCDRNGYACYLEVKARGRISTIRPNQYDFLLKKIQYGAFAGCFDNVESLNHIYFNWLNMRENGDIDRAKKYLQKNLYQPKAIREENTIPW
jgi:hypothetical protein